MRFDPEFSYKANQGLDVAINMLTPIATTFAGQITNADLWALAASVAIYTMGGPAIQFNPGRFDAPYGGSLCPPVSFFSFSFEKLKCISL